MHKLTSSSLVSRSRAAPALVLAAAGLVGCSGAVVGGAVSASPAGAAPSTTEQAIINGAVCAAEVEPTAVALLIDGTANCQGQGSFDFTAVQCTGTLIAPDVVLLAAHCVDPAVFAASTFGFCELTRSDFYVSFEADLSRYAGAGGDPNADPLPIPESAIPAREAVFDPAFDINGLSATGATGGREHDVGLLFLDVAVDGIRPEVVITKEEATQLATGTSVTIAGWGQQTATSQGQAPPAGTVGIKVCGTSTIDELGESLLQVGADPAATRKCHGDSGGPTYVEVATSSSIKRRVIGITSRAYDQEDCAKGGVDSRVDAYFDFIDAEMNSRCAAGTRAWCDVAGIIPASFFEVDEDQDEDEDDDIPDDGIPPPGCGPGCASTPFEGAAVLGLLALLRRGHRGSAPRRR